MRITTGVLLCGLCVVGLLATTPSIAQSPVMRIVAAYNGAPIAVLADSSGRLRVVNEGLLVASGDAPTVANVGANSCGTSAATLAGTQNAGAVTVGATAGTQCRITFATAATTRRHCVATNETTANLVRTTYVTTTTSDLIGTFVAGDVVTYLCLPR